MAKTKPSQVVHTVTIDLKQEDFEKYAEHVIECLGEFGEDYATEAQVEAKDFDALTAMGLSADTIKADPRVMTQFIKNATDYFADYYLGDAVMDDIYEDTEAMFKKELTALRKAAEKQEKEERKAREAEAARRAKEGVDIRVNQANEAKARAVLQAAGLL
jgi:hypothetical protein